MTRMLSLMAIAAMLIMSATETLANSGAPSHAAAATRMAVTVRQTSPIAFGTLAGSGNGGTVTINAGSGARTLSGEISALSGGDYGPAEFTITGQPGEEIVVTPPASAILDKTGASSDLVITNFKVSPGELLTLDRQGHAKIKIGGTLQMPGVTTQGAYNGFFDVSVRYTH